MHCDSALQRDDGSFAPAFCLADSRLERAGRAARQGKTASSERVKHGTAALLIIGDEVRLAARGSCMVLQCMHCAAVRV